MPPFEIPRDDPRNETLEELLERAAREKDREKFLELLHRIGQRISSRNQKVRALKTVADLPSMETDTFDLFAGPPDRHAVWRESITGMERARNRMEEVAAAAPGYYFIFHERSHAVLAQISNGPMRTPAVGPLPPLIIRAAS